MSCTPPDARARSSERADPPRSEPRTCEIHGDPMVLHRVEVTFGLPASGFLEAIRSLFPNGGVVLGGCCVPEEREIVEVEVCPTCEAARREWFAGPEGM